ncbi:unnamed protein product [Thlaspi arvense]|uniref:TF-B3 domain-containing protein n=1 Tax=Thlaspi arvense TaxID=13288 RepID=A0AAU9RKL5_THLAR|nr:unnamed protein product [Thlaspi arvense]
MNSPSNANIQNQGNYQADRITGEGFLSFQGREELFNKVLMQSDIKQYRLVIPKRLARRYFQLHLQNRSEAAFLLMEDNEEKAWNFKYSIWRSSHAHVLTGEWSKFVKEKGLKAGDVVCFSRSTGPDKRLFIDWMPQMRSCIADLPPLKATQKEQTVRLFGVNISTSQPN